MKKITILVGGDSLPENFLEYTAVVTDNMTVYHSRKLKLDEDFVKFEGTKLYCHKCFKVFDNEDELKNHKC